MKIEAALLVCLLASSAGAQELTDRERKLLDQIAQLEKRVAALEAKFETGSVNAAAPSGVPAGGLGPTVTSAPLSASASAVAPAASSNPFSGWNYGMTLDGYYAYNFNHPKDRTNALRAYDVSSNSFSLNQATFVLERPVDLAASRRFGVRVDLQYGQATQTLQGSPVNELRPDIYRPLFQAYGTYVAPVGSGLTVDFGKWASSLGIENNYTKDQNNYSRSYLFNYLPYYHLGFRSNYNLSEKVNVTWWLVNGAQQSEDFNGFKSNAFLVNVKPTKSISFNANYYFGEEGRAIDAASKPPLGKTHIFDTYLSWNATKDFSLAAEADYVVGRVNPTSSPSHVSAGALYAREQLKNGFAIAARGEYLSDRGGLFSSRSQALKEATLTFERKLADGLIVRAEWRRDFSNVPYFLTPNPNILRNSQSTATLGLVWWFGNKEGGW